MSWRSSSDMTRRASRARATGPCIPGRWSSALPSAAVSVRHATPRSACGPWRSPPASHCWQSGWAPGKRALNGRFSSRPILRPGTCRQPDDQTTLERPRPERLGIGISLAWSFLSGTPSALIEGGPYGIDQGIAVERLAEERDGAGLQGSLARLVVAVRSQNHHRNSGARARQVSEEVETIHSGHPEIEHQTAGLLLMDGLQERFGRCQSLYAEPDQSQEILQRPTHRSLP